MSEANPIGNLTVAPWRGFLNISFALDVTPIPGHNRRNRCPEDP